MNLQDEDQGLINPRLGPGGAGRCESTRNLPKTWISAVGAEQGQVGTADLQRGSEEVTGLLATRSIMASSWRRVVKEPVQYKEAVL